MKRLAVVLAVLAYARAARADDPVYLCKVPPSSTKIRVQFKPEVSIYDLSAWALGFSCKNIVFGTDVAKRAMKLTVIAPNDMTPKQAMQLFYHSLEAVGLVVVEKDDTIMIKLGPNMPRTCPDLPDASAGASRNAGAAGDAVVVTPGTPPLPAESDGDLQAYVDAGVRKIDDTHAEITSELVDKILLNPMAVAKAARVVPAMRNGKPYGFKIYAIRPSSIYAKLGFANGDTLVTINGMSLDSADKALEVYTQLRDASEFTVEIERRGKPLTLVIKIIR